jgi:signal transduction histidine kinase
LRCNNKVANESYELIRAMLAILQSGDSTDPLGLFTRFAKQIAERSTIQIDITSQGDPKQLSPKQIRQLFYIFREALSNIEKYAGADRVLGAFLWDNNALTFTISDNGRGFNPDTVQTQNHYGLKFMRQRAELLKGSFSIQSIPDQGTSIIIVVPYENGSVDQIQ